MNFRQLRLNVNIRPSARVRYGREHNACDVVNSIVNNMKCQGLGKNQTSQAEFDFEKIKSPPGCRLNAPKRQTYSAFVSQMEVWSTEKGGLK